MFRFLSHKILFSEWCINIPRIRADHYSRFDVAQRAVCLTLFDIFPDKIVNTDDEIVKELLGQVMLLEAEKKSSRMNPTSA